MSMLAAEISCKSLHSKALRIIFKAKYFVFLQINCIDYFDVVLYNDESARGRIVVDASV